MQRERPLEQTGRGGGAVAGETGSRMEPPLLLASSSWPAGAGPLLLWPFGTALERLTWAHKRPSLRALNIIDWQP